MHTSTNRVSSVALIVLGLLVAAIAASAGCGGASSFEHPADRDHQSNAEIDWRDQVMYQVMVDRYANGDPNNDLNVEPSVPARYHGGDWQGLIDKLDYLEDLGVTALWISPVVKNTEEDAGFASYHGYWTADFLRTNPHFGDLLTLRKLVDAAHAKGILVIMDVVTNHVGQLFYYDINGNGRPDDWIQGGGTSHTCVQICNNNERADECSADEQTYCNEGITYLERIIEWDPEYDPRGIQGWTSLGFSGPADIRFTDWPGSDRVRPPRPPAWFGWPADKAWFDAPSWYNRRGRVYTWWHESSYSTEFIREQEIFGDFPGGLKDLNTDNPDVQDALVAAFSYWIDVTDVDGFRIDTAKHIDRPEINPNVRGFWGDFLPRIRQHAASVGKQNFFMFGEAFDGDDTLIGSYTKGGTDAAGDFGRFDSVFYFSQKYRVIDPVFKQGKSTKNIECLYAARTGTPAGDPTWCADKGYPVGPTFGPNAHQMPAQGGIGLSPQQVPVNFLDNHDLPRFLFENDDEASLTNALFFLMTWDGIPCIYYGTEQAFAGGVDPRNREDMWLGNAAKGYPGFDQTNDTYKFVKDLIAVRKAHEALRRGDVQIKWTTERPRGERDSGIFAFERSVTSETVLVVVNTANEHASETCAPVADGGACMGTSFAPGTVLRDVAPNSDGMTFTVAADGTVQVSVPARGGRILVP